MPSRPQRARFEDRNRVHFKRTVRVPGTTIALLSRPTKLPGPSWSLPAGPACPYRRNGPNTICGSCYADNVGQYSQSTIKRAQLARFEWTRQCLRTSDGTDLFVETMVNAIDATGYRYMRVHDSGDLFSPGYTRAWIRVCEALTWVRFWFPTRSWQAPWADVIRELAALPNVAVRPSAIHFDDEPPRLDGFAAGTTVKAVGYSCPAPHRNNTCGDCRRCWIATSLPVSYHAHFVRGAAARPPSAA
jgi:hypothetical protein